jgi:hypothetical protein
MVPVLALHCTWFLGIAPFKGTLHNCGQITLMFQPPCKKDQLLWASVVDWHTRKSFF